MRVLYLAHRIPDAPTKGDKIRSFHQVCALAADHEVHVVALDDDPENRQRASWENQVASLTVVPLRRGGAIRRTMQAVLAGKSLSAAHFAEAKVTRQLAELRGRYDFDVAVVYSGAMDPLLADFHPRVVDLVDVDSEKFRAYHEQRTVRGLKRIAFGLEAKRLQHLEKHSVENAELSLLCTEQEAESLRAFAQPKRLEVWGNGVDLTAFPWAGANGRQEPLILFVGAMDYQANIDAAMHLVDDLLPKIKAQCPAARVRIVGRNPTEQVQRLSERNSVEVLANVDSVVPYLQEAQVSVLPFRIARGIQNKALEAMSAGLPVVMSNTTAEGIRGEGGVHFLTGGNTEELVEQTVTALQDPALRDRIARNARKLVETEYGWPALLQRFVHLVEETAGCRDTEAAYV